MLTRYRDIQLIEKDRDTYLAVACDVAAGIGQMPSDVVELEPRLAGYYAAVVPIIELLSIGATPISVVDTIGVPMADYGCAIIDGVHLAMEESGIHKGYLTGSTEDNIPTVNTSIGITVIAELAKSRLEGIKPHPGEHIYLVGLPKMGRQFLEEEIHGSMGEVMTLAVAKDLRLLEGISHMLPVGSRGVSYELSTMAQHFGIQIEVSENLPLDMSASAGPATCMLVTCKESLADTIKKRIHQPLHEVGVIQG